VLKDHPEIGKDVECIDPFIGEEMIITTSKQTAGV
jgi:hypothetical protein